MSRSDQSPTPDPGPLPSPLPRHVAIIMDGNGRWAQNRGMSRLRGHEEGVESVRTIVDAANEMGITALTLYAFSEENWSRPPREVSALMTLLGRFLKKDRDHLLEKGMRLITLGEIEKLPSGLVKQIRKVEADSAAGPNLTVAIALSYGGRQEITRAVRLMCQEAAAGQLDPADVDPEALARHLYTAGLPEVDLLIRTSGELRISNFLLWQLAYAEFYFTDIHWPDFRRPQFLEALTSYAQRQRRFGLTGEQAEGQT